MGLPLEAPVLDVSNLPQELRTVAAGPTWTTYCSRSEFKGGELVHWTVPRNLLPVLRERLVLRRRGQICVQPGARCTLESELKVWD